LASLGWTGVDLFFVLSGFLLGGILVDQKGADGYFRRFYIRRAARILPLYYAWIMLHAAIGASRPGFAYLLFAQNWTVALQNRVPPGDLFISWSLAIEEQFYLTLPALIAWLSLRNVRRILAACLMLAPLLRILLLQSLGPAASMPIHVLPLTHGDGLAMGVLMALTIRNDKATRWYLQHRAAVSVFMAGLALYTVAWLLRLGTQWLAPRTAHLFTPIAMVCGWLVFDCVAKPRGVLSRLCRLSVLQFFGRISYCLYLIHWLVLAEIERWAAHGISIHSADGAMRFGFLCAASAFGISILVCSVSFRYFERPILNWSANLLRPLLSKKASV